MTVTSTNTLIIYTGSGGLAFVFTFPILETSDMVVKTEVIATGVQATLTETTDYTVDEDELGGGFADGGTVTLTTDTFPSGLSSAYKIIISRVLPITQETDLVANDAAGAETFEQTLDKQIMVSQQIQEQIDRCIKIGISVTGIDVNLPNPESGKVIGWDSAGTALTNYLSDSSLTTAFVAEHTAATGVHTAITATSLAISTGGIEVGAGGADVGTTTVAGGVDGDSLYLRRNASNFRFYINQYGNANITVTGGCRLDAGGTFNFQPESIGDATFFESANQWTTNRNVRIAGWITGVAAKYVNFTVNDTTDNFELTREDANIGAFDIQMPLLANSLTLAQDGKLELNPAPSATDKATGTIASMSVTTNTVGIGGLLHLHTTGAWVDADMNAATSMPCMAIALGTTGTIDVLLNGIITDTGWSWTVGGIMYANTAGTMTQTAPSGSNDQVQAVGIALSATTVYFNPSPVLVEVA